MLLQTARELFRDFLRTLDVQWHAPAEILSAAEDAVDGCVGWTMRSAEDRERRLLGLVNSKLKLNRGRFQIFLDAAAERRVSFNYHDKAAISEWFDFGDFARFGDWIRSQDIDPTLIGFFRPCTRDETLRGLHEQLSTGHVVRKDAKKSSIETRKAEVLQALFASYVFHAYPVEAMHRHFNADCRKEYLSDFYKHLLRFHPKALHRDCAMILLRIDEQLRGDLSPEIFRDRLFSYIRESYERLSNHCFFAILIEPLSEGRESAQWRLFSDLILYAEKHREVHLKAGYFRPREIERATIAHIPKINRREAHFDVANEGFFFRDCFVLCDKEIKINGATQKHWDPVELLLIFEKNERDESVIPCPGCRSRGVRGNSYSSLGVRSWECCNPICPEKSAFDRGNRYSLSALIKQEAIKSDDNRIPEDSLKRWKLDVVSGVKKCDVTDMLLRHFTLHGDTAVFVNAESMTESDHGRIVRHEPFAVSKMLAGEYQRFQNSSFFQRFRVVRHTNVPPELIRPLSCSFPGVNVYRGDCCEVLGELDSESVDGAVTSPPYFNARSYSVWPNVYSYLYDMYNSAIQVYRVLKPGATYLFNIFDYFDNENSIVFSAMGKKRMILGAYIISLFRSVGFELVGNIAWHKGEIEGKRNFNQGNRSPYYQFPFNCWEHVLVFQKLGRESQDRGFPTILQSKPVVKMIRGENVLGHSAPFPSIIPELLLDTMSTDECVLDPYSGSMTTGRAAYKRGIRSVSIELHREYCDLGLRLLQSEQTERGDDLFSALLSDVHFPELLGMHQGAHAAK
jgi:DNA modification methylase